MNNENTLIILSSRKVDDIVVIKKAILEEYDVQEDIYNTYFILGGYLLKESILDT